MKLTENQIQELYIFTRKHYVEWYDLQTELVDHLANDIESLWENKPELSFEKALNLCFKKFGVFGFADVITKRQKALERKYYAMLMTFLKTYFKLPKIIFTVFLVCLFYLLFGFLDETYLYQIVFAVFLLFASIFFYLTYRNKRKLGDKFGFGEKKFMLQEIASNTTILFQFPNLILQLFILSGIHVPSEIQIWSFSFLFSIFLLAGHISYFVLPNKIDVYLSETYPEYVKST